MRYMKLGKYIIAVAAIIFQLEAAAQVLDETSRYTAQRRPRVTVDQFEDTNAAAEAQRYSASVEAMLVTFLKQRSQVVVVERQKLGSILAEWKLNQEGFTNLQPGELEILEKIDAIIQGSVTLLNEIVESKANISEKTAGSNPEGRPETTERKSGQKIEIDIKLLSRIDGRIIAAAQRSGPVTCLRSIVYRLGAALEQEFLRPYHGNIRFTLSSPENVDIFLTPILAENALDEEKPPIERGVTHQLDTYSDQIENWTTAPTSYTIDKILSGWYTMRLERPGYDGMGTENSNWQARDRYGSTEILDIRHQTVWTQAGKDESRFVVHVGPQRTEVIDGDALGLKFEKKNGSFTPSIKRSLVDRDFAQTETMRIYLEGGPELEINGEGTNRVPSDRSCDVTIIDRPRQDYGETVVTRGSAFDIETFRGGKLILEDYRGEPLPAGKYSMWIWEQDYQTHLSDVTVKTGDHRMAARRVLNRQRCTLSLTATAARPGHHLLLRGAVTQQEQRVPLTFGEEERMIPGLPCDLYKATVDIPELSSWTRETPLVAESSPPPTYDSRRKARSEAEIEPVAGEPPSPVSLRVKTRLAVAGNRGILASDAALDGVGAYFDRLPGQILDQLLGIDRESARSDSRIRAQFQFLVPDRKADPPQQSPERQSLSPQSGLVDGSVAAVRPPTSDTNLASTTLSSANNQASDTQAAAPPPLDPQTLRRLLIGRLSDIDLLLLDDHQMTRLREQPEVSSIVEDFLSEGGSLFAFVSSSGDYEDIVGAPLSVETTGKKSPRLDLSSGDIHRVTFTFHKEKVKTKKKRILPKVKRFRKERGDWRVLAYTRGKKDPRVLERGGRGSGGYVALWLDQLEAFRGRRGAKVPEIENSRATVEGHILRWANYQMHRRFDPESEITRELERSLPR